MQDLNNFSNLIEVRGRSFDLLRENMAKIDVPASIVHITLQPTGQYVAILMADRKVRKTKTRPEKKED